MKTVLDPQTVAHYWANKVQSNARNSNSSFYFENETIYSYGRHFPIAKHINGKVLFTTRTYSNTTAKHISTARAACSHIERIYAPYVDGRHSDNFEAWTREIQANINSMKTARKPEKYFAAIEHTKNEARIYCDFLGIKPPKDLKKLLSLTFENTEAMAKKQAAKDKKEREIIEKKGGKLFEKYLQLWRQGATYEQISEQIKDRATHNKYINGKDFTYLRLTGADVETSKGVKLPIEVAKRYLNAYFDNTLKAGEKILHYTIKQADARGLVIGCHNIPASQIQWLQNAI
jgi:hypothetical protein